ncbi:MAG: aminotransferase class III-fold pyridoxal phosphate-dependent enzyme [Planctomycetaceae bacterium]
MVPKATTHGLRALPTCEQMIAGQTPNLLRLHLNPWVAQTCVCLNHYAQTLAFLPDPQSEDCPSFLTNSREEALSGALKLARFTVNGRPHRARSGTVILVDPHERYPHFGSSQRTDGSRVEFVPGIIRCGESELVSVLNEHSNAGIVVLADGSQTIAELVPLRDLWLNPDVITIRCVNTKCVPVGSAERTAPRCDIVVFDESFVNHDVPFAAFTARRSLFAPWFTGKMSMFHSTTFQPNSLTTIHFMECLGRHDPATVHMLHDELLTIETDRQARHDVYHRLYSPSLSKLIALTGFDRGEVKASGHFVTVCGGRRADAGGAANAEWPDRRIFDGVAGVACSLRGHNPPNFPDEIRETLGRDADLFDEVSRHLQTLTGLAHHVPAVSGAAAVEQALQIALSIQPDRPHVLALEDGFGGKTLAALTGTSRTRYKQNLGPLYQHVTYVNPFAPTAVDDIRRALADDPVGVVQVELIQGVGGVRPIPQPVLDVIRQERDAQKFLLFVDEVQTGMFRTGPFVRSLDVGISPDILTIGKGTSDTIFPFAATLYSDDVRNRLTVLNPELPHWIRERHQSAPASAALLNTLRRAEHEDWSTQVRRQSNVFQQELTAVLKGCRNVSDVRVFGMLIGIELNVCRLPIRLLKKQMGKLYSLAMLNHPQHPLLIGFCQYEPHIFKLTPGLLMDEEHIRTVCSTIGETLHRSPLSVAAAGLKTISRRQ